VRLPLQRHLESCTSVVWFFSKVWVWVSSWNCLGLRDNVINCLIYTYFYPNSKLTILTLHFMTYHLLVVPFNYILYDDSELRMGIPEQIQVIWWWWYDTISSPYINRFENYFTGTFYGHFSKVAQKIPLLHKHVATLPCKISMSEKQYIEELSLWKVNLNWYGI